MFYSASSLVFGLIYTFMTIPNIVGLKTHILFFTLQVRNSMYSINVSYTFKGISIKVIQMSRDGRDIQLRTVDKTSTMNSSQFIMSLF